MKMRLLHDRVLVKRIAIKAPPLIEGAGEKDDIQARARQLRSQIEETTSSALNAVVLQNGAEVAAIMLTTEALIAEQPQSSTAGHGMHDGAAGKGV